ncbi:hypothetical protein OHA88_08320 [Streptomyces sp. NBC_00353]|uniref:hypothetical protein n=1 Tax=Streptomyces sp. NBC_00353 TaxID=2975722 RepID=UPI002E255975
MPGIPVDAVQGFGTVTVDPATADFLKALAGETRRKVMQQFTRGIELMTFTRERTAWPPRRKALCCPPACTG